MDIEQMRIRMGEMAAEIERLNAYIDQLLDPNSEPSLGVAISKTENTTQSPAVAVPDEETNFCALKSIKDSEVAKVARSFWRRIYPYRNDLGIELPHPLPVEFMAHMATALTWVDREQSPRITEQDAREILESFCKFGHYSSDIGAFLCDSIFRELLDKLNGANHE